MTPTKKTNSALPMILVILDGWGIAEPYKGNAVTLAKTPVMNALLKKYPNTLLCAHGEGVGLPAGQVGNSEAGHANIGAGRIVDQDVIKITKSIEDGTFFRNASFVEAVRHVKKYNSRLHLMGLISNEMSPHSDPGHITALLEFAREQHVNNVCLHLFTDGRDSHRYAGLKLINDLQKKLVNGEKICTIMGRFYAMDRKKKWERSEMAYNALVLGEGRHAESAQAAITESYNRGESDEYIEPYIIGSNGGTTPRISDNDSVIFFNLRSDRGRQLTKVFVQEEFEAKNKGSFQRKKILKGVHFTAMTDFGPDLGNMLTAFPTGRIKNTLPLQLADLSQLYIAETEKYAHVTYFFNGGYGDGINGESQFMIPSPDVKSYDETPGMSTEKLAKKIISNLKNKLYDFTVLNFAAPDMIGHTGNIKAGIECCEIIDESLGRIVDAYLSAGGTVLVTADHGNIEAMIDPETDEVLTEHTSSPVPFILVNNHNRKSRLRKGGYLSDIAPTILELLDRPQPEEMSGKSLITT